MPLRYSDLTYRHLNGSLQFKRTQSDRAQSLFPSADSLVTLIKEGKNQSNDSGVNRYKGDLSVTCSDGCMERQGGNRKRFFQRVEKRLAFCKFESTPLVICFGKIWTQIPRVYCSRKGSESSPLIDSAKLARLVFLAFVSHLVSLAYRFFVPCGTQKTRTKSFYQYFSIDLHSLV